MGVLIVLVNIALSFIVGLFLINLSLEIITIDMITNYLTQIPANFNSKLITFLIGILLMLFCLRYIQTIFRRRKRNKSITFESDEGKVSITLVAIEEMLKKLLEEKTEVSHIKPKVILKKKHIEVAARGILTTEVNLVDFTKEIQKQVKEKLHALLGEDKQVRVNLEIRKIALGKKELTDEKEPEIPFRNYD